MIFDMETTEEIQSLMSKLNAKLEKLNKEVNRLEEIKRNLQNLCEHDWQMTGNNTHKDEYKCSICGKIEME